MTVFYATLFLMGVPGNFLTCLIIFMNSYMRASPNYYLFNLAVADILTLSIGKILVSTVVKENIGTLTIGEICFLDFHHLSKSIQLQIILQLKALIQSFQNQERNWAWPYPEGGHALLIEKAPVPLILGQSFSKQKFFQFQNFFQTLGNRAFF